MLTIFKQPILTNRQTVANHKQSGADNKLLLIDKKLAVIIPIILAAIMAATVIFALKDLPSKLPLFYSQAWGEFQLVSHNSFLILPAAILTTTLLNLFLANLLHPSQHFFKHLLLVSSLLVSLILLITLTKIILIFI